MLTIDCINVGYGDAVLVRETGGPRPFTLLVDAGDASPGERAGADGRIPAAEFLQSEGVRTIDLLVLTHLHRDHVGGLDALLATVRVRRLWTNYLPAPRFFGASILPRAAECAVPSGIAAGVDMYLSALAPLELMGCAMEGCAAPRAGVALTPALNCDLGCCDPYLYHRYRAAIEGLIHGAPDCCELTLLRAYMNLTSLRLVLTYRGRRVFLPADAYADYWEDDAAGPCHLLKVPHHGCAGAVTERLLHALRPEIAVVSAPGCCTVENCPDPDMVRLLRAYCGSVRFTGATADETGKFAPAPSVRVVIE